MAVFFSYDHRDIVYWMKNFTPGEFPQSFILRSDISQRLFVFIYVCGFSLNFSFSLYSGN